MRRILLPSLAALSVAACATPPPTIYQQATGPQAMGFTDSRIEPGRYSVTFRGGEGAPRDQVTDYALRRAAELAVADGYDWFRVTRRFVSWDRQGGQTQVGLSVGGVSFGRGSAVGGSLGTAFNLSGGPALTATLEVLMGRGPKPPDGDVYDARGVLRSIGGGA